MTLELSWNLLQDYMKEQGLNFQPIPKDIYREAFNKRIIDDGQVWIDAVEARNLALHAYNEDTT